MNATFLVTLDLPDTTAPTLAQTVEEILDDLEMGGHSVVAVKEWHRPSLATTSPSPSLTPTNNLIR